MTSHPLPCASVSLLLFHQYFQVKYSSGGVSFSVSAQFVLGSKLKLHVCLKQQKSEADVGQKTRKFSSFSYSFNSSPDGCFFEASIHQKSNRFLWLSTNRTNSIGHNRETKPLWHELLKLLLKPSWSSTSSRHVCLRGRGLDLRELPSPDSSPCSDIFSFNRKISFLKSAMMLVYWAMWYDTLNWLGLVCKHKRKIIQIGSGKIKRSRISLFSIKWSANVAAVTSRKTYDLIVTNDIFDENP